MKNDEAKLQVQCHTWLWNNYPVKRGLFFSIKNNSKNAIEGSIDKAKGMVKGVADYVIIFQTETAYIEFKTLKGTQSKEQKHFASQIAYIPHSRYYIVKSFDEFKELVQRNGF